MRTVLSGRSKLVAAAALVAIGLSGCGKSSAVATGKEDWKGVFTTAADCADSGKLSYDECADAMAAAVVDHEKNAPTYRSLTSCAAKEGDGRCENAVNGQYRPRLLAFLLTTTAKSATATAVPLYPPPKGKAGFRDTASNLYTTDNDQIVFSEHAQTMFETHAKKKK